VTTRLLFNRPVAWIAGDDVFRPAVNFWVAGRFGAGLKNDGRTTLRKVVKVGKRNDRADSQRIQSPHSPVKGLLFGAKSTNTVFDFLVH